MKKALILLLCLFSLLYFVTPVASAQSRSPMTYKETTLDGGIDINMSITCDKNGNISWT